MQLVDLFKTTELLNNRYAFLAHRTATQYDRLLQPVVGLSVCLSVTLCILALRVGVRG